MSEIATDTTQANGEATGERLPLLACFGIWACVAGGLWAMILLPFLS